MTSDGLLRCSRYAFGPNRLHYCGPDANRELFSYMEHEVADPGLTQILRAFSTMYPYLRMIAHANGIRDAFDERVVEAYWIGNSLLDTIRTSVFYNHLRDEQQIGRRLGKKTLDLLGEKLRAGAVPHHSFHVLDIWKRTGHLEREHTLESMDSCRISWGTVTEVDGPSITIETQPLILRVGKLALGEKISKKVVRNLGAELEIEQLKPGQSITMHWGVPCEVVSSRQASELKRRTEEHIRLANTTL
ncbi:MAG: hypothetical protein HY566_01015 [Candidatus Kerfeldbacteria bacterium]|nr:hypothetical protein [Candidatus Kerfeldbacteria bacterium]